MASGEGPGGLLQARVPKAGLSPGGAACRGSEPSALADGSSCRWLRASRPGPAHSCVQSGPALWTGQLSDAEAAGARVAVCGLEGAWRVSGGCALSAVSLASGEILGGAPHCCPLVADEEMEARGAREGPVRVSATELGGGALWPRPPWVDAGVCQYPGISGLGWGGGALRTPLGLVLVPVARWPPGGPGASRGQNCLWTEDLPPSDPSVGQGAESRGPLWDLVGWERESLSASPVWGFSSCCP